MFQEGVAFPGGVSVSQSVSLWEREEVISRLDDSFPGGVEI
jgi:hypothetical protein